MRVLIVGSGGREHALAWAVRRSARVTAVYVAPGNAGTRDVAENVDIAATDLDALVAFATSQRIDLTIVGPEAPLTLGIVDRFRAASLVCYGPTAAAARLEGSKAFAKEFMQRHRIPTAAFAVCDNATSAKAFARTLPVPLVVKADGLAAGKGVVVASSHAEAEAAIDDMMVARRFGDAGGRVVVEEFLAGEEVSVHAVCAGTRAVLFPSSQDHKRAHDGDAGPNTGGMGAIAPVPWVTPADLDRVQREVIEPVLRGMAAEGSPFSGTLYAGLMWTAAGPRVLEFNVRFGDPETEVLMPLLDGDVAEFFLNAAVGNLPPRVNTRAGSAAAIVLAAPGYPEHAQTGGVIAGLGAASGANTMVFHAGTRVENGRVCIAGGRVLAVTAWAQTLAAALAAAYARLETIHSDGAFYRRDIGRRHLTVPPERMQS